MHIPTGASSSLYRVVFATPGLISSSDFPKSWLFSYVYSQSRKGTHRMTIQCCIGCSVNQEDIIGAVENIISIVGDVQQTRRIASVLLVDVTSIVKASLENITSIVGECRQYCGDVQHTWKEDVISVVKRSNQHCRACSAKLEDISSTLGNIQQTSRVLSVLLGMFHTEEV